MKNLTNRINLLRKNSGLVLLEAVVALSILIIILAAISVVVTVSLNNSNFIKHQNIANKYAQEAMEYLQSQRSTDYDTFKTYLNLPEGKYCMGDGNQIVSVAVGGDCTVNVASTYKREIEFDKNSPDCLQGSTQQLKATVTVWWSGSKCTQDQPYCHKSQLVSCFSDELRTL